MINKNYDYHWTCWKTLCDACLWAEDMMEILRNTIMPEIDWGYVFFGTRDMKFIDGKWRKVK